MFFRRLKFAWQAFRLKEGQMLFAAYTDDLHGNYECDKEDCHEDTLLCVSGLYYQIKRQSNDHLHACAEHAIAELRALGCPDIVLRGEGEKFRSIR